MTTRSVAAPSASLEGQYAGPVTRALAYAADSFIVLPLYGLLLSLVVFFWNLLSKGDLDIPEQSAGLWLIGLWGWMFLYNGVCWSLWWRTPGKGLVGLRIVMRDGADLTGRNAWLRALVYPVAVLIPFSTIGVIVGRERRALHDVVAGTTVVYDWDARRARWRLLARRGPQKLNQRS